MSNKTKVILTFIGIFLVLISIGFVISPSNKGLWNYLTANFHILNRYANPPAQEEMPDMFLPENEQKEQNKNKIMKRYEVPTPKTIKKAAVKPKNTCHELWNGVFVACENASESGMNQVAAVKLCRDKGMRLPTAAELKLIYTDKDIIGNMTPKDDMGGWPYWSSTILNGRAVRMTFADGKFGKQGETQVVGKDPGSGYGAFCRCVKD